MCIHICVYIYMHVSLKSREPIIAPIRRQQFYVCTYIYIYTYICIYIHIYLHSIHIYICMYIYVYLYTYVYTSQEEQRANTRTHKSSAVLPQPPPRACRHTPWEAQDQKAQARNFCARAIVCSSAQFRLALCFDTHRHRLLGSPASRACVLCRDWRLWIWAFDSMCVAVNFFVLFVSAFWFWVFGMNMGVGLDVCCCGVFLFGLLAFFGFECVIWIWVCDSMCVATEFIWVLGVFFLECFIWTWAFDSMCVAAESLFRVVMFLGFEYFVWIWACDSMCVAAKCFFFVS